MKNNLFFKVNKLIKIIKIKNLINLISISLLISLMEFLSIFSIYPVFYYLENKKIVNNDYYNFVYSLFPVLSDNYVFEKILLISLILIFITSLIIYLRFSRKYKIKESIINRNRQFVFELISKTNLFHFKKIDHELIKSYLSIETQRISQIILSFSNLCSSFFVIILLSLYILYIEPYLILIILITILFLWTFLSKTYSESKILGSNLATLNNNFIKFIDKVVNDKVMYMLSANHKDNYAFENDVTKNIHLTQYLIQKKSAFIEFAVRLTTLSIILVVIYIFYINKVELSLILFSGVIFIRLVPFLSQFGNSLQNLKSNFPSIDKLIFIENKFKIVSKINLENTKLEYIEIDTNILKSKNIENQGSIIRLYPRNIYGLYGSSGIGKTTFVESLLGLNMNSNFKISLNSNQIISNSIKCNILANSSYFSQNTIPNNYLITDLFTKFKKNDLENYFKLFEISNTYNEIKNRKLSEFSGGEQQRIGLIYILLQNKKLIILDEPTSGLDRRLSKIFMNLLSEHVHKYNNLCVVVSHDQIVIDFLNNYLKFKNKIEY